MGTTTDGQICFGILMDEDWEASWDTDEYDYDPDTWWLKIGGFEPTFYPFTEAGEFKEGLSTGSQTVDNYYHEIRAWRSMNPCPIEPVNVCSCKESIWILAVPGTLKTASRGYPEPLDPTKLQLASSDPKLTKMLSFLRYKLGMTNAGDAKWYLSSYWGQ